MLAFIEAARVRLSGCSEKRTPLRTPVLWRLSSVDQGKRQHLAGGTL